MFRQVSARNRLKPAKQQFFAVLDARPVQANSIGMVLRVFATKPPHEERQCQQAIKQALTFANHVETQEKRRCRVESVKQDFRPGWHINPFVDVVAPGSPGRFGDSIKIKIQ